MPKKTFCLRSISIMTLTLSAALLLQGCTKEVPMELESYQEPPVKISELPQETTTEPPIEPPTAPTEVTTEPPTEPPTEPAKQIRVIFDSSGADSSTFKVQSFEERVGGQAFTGGIARDGYEFLGWALTQGAQEASYSANHEVSDAWIQEMSDQYGDTMTLYAVWQGPVYTPLTPGEVSEGVWQMQVALETLGYYNSGVDGSYGPGTVRAVSAFRAANGLSEDGNADTEMLTLLYQQVPLELEPQS